MATLMIDRRFKGLGRLQRRSGTNDPKTFKKYNAMLTNLWDNGKTDILTALQRGTISFAEVYAKWNKQDLSKLVVVQDVITVHDIDNWITTADFSEHTKRGYKGCLAPFIRLYPNTTITQLPNALASYRKHCETSGIIRSFNQLRSVLQSYITKTFGRHTQLWADISNVAIIKGGGGNAGRAHSYYDTLDVIAQLEPHHGEMWHSMVLSGMGPAEYWGEWEVDGETIKIHGTKRDARDRVIPKFGNIVKPTITIQCLRHALKKVAPDWQLYDGRRSFAHMLEEAKIVRARRIAYMGHAAGDVTGLYERHEIEQYLKSDREQVIAYLDGITKEWKQKNGNPKADEFFTFGTA